MSDSLETAARTPVAGAPLTPLGATDAELCADGVCLVPPAEETVDED